MAFLCTNKASYEHRVKIRLDATAAESCPVCPGAHRHIDTGVSYRCVCISVSITSSFVVLARFNLPSYGTWRAPTCCCDHRSCSRSHWQFPLLPPAPPPPSPSPCLIWLTLSVCVCVCTLVVFTVPNSIQLAANCASPRAVWLRLTNFGNNRATITATTTTTRYTYMYMYMCVSPCNGLDVPLSIVCPKLSIGNCQVAESAAVARSRLRIYWSRSWCCCCCCCCVLFVQLAIYYKQIYVHTYVHSCLSVWTELV